MVAERFNTEPRKRGFLFAHGSVSMRILSHSPNAKMKHSRWRPAMRRQLMCPLFLCLWPGLALGQTQSGSTKDKDASAQEKPKLAKLLSVNEGSVYAKGVWRPDNPTKKNEPLEAVTELSCFRHGGKVLAGTEAFCLQAMAMSPGGLLDVSTDWLKVVEWSATQIIATDDSSICLTSQTIFDLKRKTVIALDIRKPEAQGLGGACNLLPDRQTYYLQDKVDYFAQKSLGTTK